MAPPFDAPRLRSLVLSGCGALDEVTALQGAAALATLELDGCASLSDLSPLFGCAALDALSLSGCAAVDLSPLAACPLTVLDLTGCARLAPALPADLGGGGRLQTLILAGCVTLADISALAACASLHSLSVALCTSLFDLAPLAGCASLHTLSVAGCPAAASNNLSALSGCAALRVLHGAGLPGMLPGAGAPRGLPPNVTVTNGPLNLPAAAASTDAVAQHRRFHDTKPSAGRQQARAA